MAPRIYVSIASYRDPFLQRTIDAIYCSADSPEQITVGCFVQAFPEELLTTVPINRYGYKVYYRTAEPGTIFSVTECRNRCLEWLDDSYDYVLQIDSHTEFDAGWDTYLIDLMSKLNDERSIISCILPEFGIRKDGRELRIKQDKIRNVHPDERTSKQALMNNYELVFPVVLEEPIPNTNYANGWYLSGHFIFAPSKYFIEITQPSWVLFWGEELLNSIRAYTAGWNVYIPQDIPIYHLAQHLTDIPRPKIWDDFPNSYFKQIKATTDRVIDTLLNKHPEEIFDKRSLDQLYTMIGHNLGEIFDGWRQEKNSSVLH